MIVAREREREREISISFFFFLAVDHRSINAGWSQPTLQYIVGCSDIDSVNKKHIELYLLLMCILCCRVQNRCTFIEPVSIKIHNTSIFRKRRALRILFVIVLKSSREEDPYMVGPYMSHACKQIRWIPEASSS